MSGIVFTSKQIHRKRITMKSLIIACKLQTLKAAMEVLGDTGKSVEAWNQLWNLRMFSLKSGSSRVKLHFFFFFLSLFLGDVLWAGITYLLVAHVKRINVRKKQCLFPLYFKTSYFWHPSLRMALSQRGGWEVSCVDWSILWPIHILGRRHPA